MMARMRDSADMPKLQQYPTAFVMHRINDGLPTIYLLIAVDSGCAWIALALPRNLRRLGDDETAATCPLRVELRVEHSGYRPRIRCPHPRQRSHHDAMSEFELADLNGRMKRRCHVQPLR